MIYNHVSKSDFIEAFRSMDREDNFTVNALCQIYEYYNEFGIDIELDVIAICCEWSEYDADELEREYQQLIDVGNYDNDDDRFDALLEEMPNNTMFYQIHHNGDVANTYLVMDF